MSKKSRFRDEDYGFYDRYYPYNSFRYFDEGALIRLVYAFLLLVVIVIQFSKDQDMYNGSRPVSACGLYGDDICEGCTRILYAGRSSDNIYGNQLIDNSILFLIVVFLLILCSGYRHDGYTQW